LYEIVPAGVEFAGGEGFEDFAGVDGTQTAESAEGDTNAEDVEYVEEMEHADDAESAERVDDMERVQPQTPAPPVDPLKYQPATAQAKFIPSDELMTVKLRFKPHDGDTSALMEVPFIDNGMTVDEASEDFRFAASVAAFGMLLRGSSRSGDATFDMVRDLAESGMGAEDSHRLEYLDLVEKAASLKKGPDQK
jgi:hypothetical protein